MVYEITVRRKVQTFQYESLEVGLVEEFDDSIDRDKAFQQSAKKVAEWIESELLIMGLNPKHPT